MTIQDLKDKNLIIFEALTGSHAYGLNEEGSDIDYKGVFVLPLDELLSGDYISEISDEKNDITYFEIGRFIELLNKSNPTAVELLFSPVENIRIKHECFDVLLKNKEKYISKRLKDTFGKYAEQQIKKARGLNKKIVKPVAKEKKSPLDFCFVIDGYKTYPLTRFLSKNGLSQKFCGIVNVPNARDVFSLFYDEFSHACFDERLPEDVRMDAQSKFQHSLKGYKGIVKENESGELISNELRYSSVKETETPRCIFSYNKDGYTSYCKDYSEYWAWVAKRNPVRYETNMKHGKNYDSKNLLHCTRLIKMCLEVGQGKGMIVKRPDRELLLNIKHGNREYDDIISDANAMLQIIEEVYNTSDMLNDVDVIASKIILKDLRKEFYNIK
jgi:predicted nucleotidyltransferase